MPFALSFTCTYDRQSPYLAVLITDSHHAVLGHGRDRPVGPPPGALRLCGAAG
jgi:hypothetical protein